MIQIFNENFKSKELVNDYNIIESGDEIILIRSENSAWVDECKGDKVATLLNDGNGVIITIESIKKSIKLNYAEARELLILLMHDNDSSIEIRESKTIKKI